MRKETDSCPEAVPRRGRSRQLRRRAQRRAPLSTEGKPHATALTAPASKRHKGSWLVSIFVGEGFLRERAGSYNGLE